ncbi:DeoR/GlpR family DNA-binding transcription regulator [Amycolatopsis sp. CA-230715]|uniref:DeoR/GlpR family DNA-binding transcription regulator n=1 Tax=Amycolatopsis sp. CA-230715 TaxID=2745196 RepID=UPI001C012973|nr:DeoR/GlpR family DNA-binding transcription regulator [Amycolatopsis sp. CA-230715]QWF78325.1 Glycerol-3-phosphate regulon repressor [Amycolatopsis sp. CA-230715]
MKRHVRLARLLEIVGERGKVEVEELSAELTVSTATVRRDLDHLAEQSLLTRTRGGAVASSVSYDLPLRYKSGRHAPQKSRIATEVAALVPPGAVVGLNGGTTTTEVARLLSTRRDLTTRDGPGLTVVTNALNIAAELAVRRHLKLVVTGGVARPHSFELTGPLATKVLSEIALDLVILGVDALDPEGGAFAHHEGEANINRLMVRRGTRVVVAADSSKLGLRAFARICEIGAVHTVVTDAEVHADLKRRFEAAGVDLRAV